MKFVLEILILFPLAGGLIETLVLIANICFWIFNNDELFSDFVNFASTKTLSLHGVTPTNLYNFLSTSFGGNVHSCRAF